MIAPKLHMISNRNTFVEHFAKNCLNSLGHDNGTALCTRELVRPHHERSQERRNCPLLPDNSGNDQKSLLIAVVRAVRFGEDADDAILFMGVDFAPPNGMVTPKRMLSAS